MTYGQASLFDAIYRKLSPRLAVLCYTQFGKEISHSVPVLTTNGWKRHGNLKIGDHVFNDKGKSVRVNALLGESNKNEYEIEFTNGEKIVCHGKHEWIVKHRSWKEFREVETEKLFNEKLRYKGVNSNNFVIPKIKPIEFEEKELVVDPYTLGAWLGDGITTKPSIVAHPKDKIVIGKIPYEVSSKQVHKKTGVVLYNFYRSDFFKGLKELGLIIRSSGGGYKGEGYKRIPDIYKRASVKQRLELLAGLIDSDGSVSSKKRKEGWIDNRVYISNTNKELVDDIIELIRGLGMKPSVTMIPACLSNSGIQGKKDVYCIGFESYIDIPTQIPRKKIVPKKKKHISIKSIIKVEPEKGRCINVEGGVYLVGKRLIPTHNSEIVAMAVLTRITTFPEKWVIIGGSEEKAKIIMNKLIGHIFDNDYTKNRLTIKKADSLERLRHERSRNRVTFNVSGGVGEVFVLSGDVKKKGDDAGDILVGHGAPNIISDDSQLLPNVINAKMVRMLGGHKENFMMKIGNATCTNSHHFYKSYYSDRYTSIMLNYKVGIEEGRQPTSFFNEMREEMNDKILFDAFYGCIFPPADTPLSGLWMPLLTEDDIERAMEETKHFGQNKLGVDVADSGIDHDAIVLRSAGFAEVLYDNQESNQTRLTGLIVNNSKDLSAKVYLDRRGVGSGISGRLREIKFPHTEVDFGGSPSDKRFANKKAELFWRGRNWILKGGKLSRDPRWKQLSNVLYTVDDTSGKIKIMPKKVSINMGIKSPDIGDAFACTFNDGDRYKTEEKNKEENFRRIIDKKKKKRLDSRGYNLKMV